MASTQSGILRFLLRKTVNWNKPLDEIRSFHRNVEKKEAIPAGVLVEKITFPEFDAEWFIPENSNKQKTLIYFHGGGYCLGIVHANRNFVMKLASEFSLPVLLLNYRLAPENPFPAALNDAVALYEWLTTTKMIKPADIGCIGDSSGCGLCLAMMQVLKEKGLQAPHFQAFMSPVVDLKRSGESFRLMAKKDPMQMKPEFYIDNHYINGNDPSDPLISPLYADHTGYPKTFIQASEYDVFMSDSVMLSQKLKESNVDVEFSLWKKMWHNFQMSAAILPEGRKAIAEINNYITKHLN